MNQASLLLAVQAYAAKHAPGITRDQLERGTYALRCMISQLANHKQRRRPVPKEWQPTFQTIAEKIQTSEKNQIDIAVEEKSLTIMCGRLHDSGSVSNQCDLF